MLFMLHSALFCYELIIRKHLSSFYLELLRFENCHIMHPHGRSPDLDQQADDSSHLIKQVRYFNLILETLYSVLVQFSMYFDSSDSLIILFIMS